MLCNVPYIFPVPLITVRLATHRKSQSGWRLQGRHAYGGPSMAFSVFLCLNTPTTVSTCFYEEPLPSWLYCPDSYPTPHGAVSKIASLPDAIAAMPVGTPLPLHALPWVLRSFSDSCDSACMM
ncbi:hypothetical protein E2C01_017988 [Portunus trituberculatus]|uniref:Uncharacterized protein n=1 Tax=Portunus trituberculatus TaxID=210409 RepID=A0A5B7DVK6_PORTR|nr:hypothetical protein [Portunus trituberculatus]